MAKVTRIKASDGPRKKDDDSDAPTITRKKVVVKDKKTAKAKREKVKSAEKKITATEPGKEKKEKKPFILFVPFVYLWRYLRDSWMELRQVRWPDRKTTWKMVLAVIIYSAMFMVIISLLDLFFSWLFGLILGNK
ncbi:preprotein translocase subunit SecE [Candidatus Saccharibacteria bacterium]|nr:preprotein translocase subunit SecE [Candidatus Saccharibacteria bacterium]